MTTTTHIFVAATLAVTGFGNGSQQARAASFAHVDRLALELRGQAGQLHQEFRQHFAHTANYRHLISDASEMVRLADHIHDVAHRGSLGHMARDLAELDRLFHHVEDLVAKTERDARSGHGRPMRHGGHVHGNTRHVRQLLHKMENTLHHLRDDVSKISRPRPIAGHAHPRPSVIHSGPTLSLSNGRIQFRIGF